MALSNDMDVVVAILKELRHPDEHFGGQEALTRM